MYAACVALRERVVPNRMKYLFNNIITNNIRCVFVYFVHGGACKRPSFTLICKKEMYCASSYK